MPMKKRNILNRIIWTLLIGQQRMDVVWCCVCVIERIRRHHHIELSECWTADGEYWSEDEKKKKIKRKCYGRKFFF